MPHIPDEPTPGRYEVRGYSGRRYEVTNTWRRRRDAEENAIDLLVVGYSAAFGSRYSRTEVVDRVNRYPIFQHRRPKKTYGAG